MARKAEKTITCQVCCDIGYISYILHPADRPKHKVRVMELCNVCNTAKKKRVLTKQEYQH